MAVITKELDEEMKKIFYEMVTCTEKEFDYIKDTAINDKHLTPKSQFFMNIFIKNVSKARENISYERKEKKEKPLHQTKT